MTNPKIRIDRSARCRIVLRSAIVLLLAVELVRAETPLPPVPHRHVVTISKPESRGNEPSVAVNPNNPEQIVAAFQPATVVYSEDGGNTFSTADLPSIEGWPGGGDVSVTFDSRGRAYLGTLHFEKLGSVSYWAHGAGRNGIFVRRSLDAGKTWEKSDTPVKLYEGGDPGSHMEDMPRIFADTNPQSPYAGNIYIGWIEWQLDQSIMLFARSTDSGKSFSRPARISTHAGLPRDDNGGLVGFVGVVAGDGSIYAIWNDGSRITFTQSRDGGQTFAPSRAVVEVGPPYFGGAGGIPGVSRAMGFPQIGVDSRDTKRSVLYLAWSDYRNGDVDVFCISSKDRGRTWSQPVRVNNDPIHDGIDQFFQWMAVDSSTGDVYVQFYDRRGDPNNRRTGFTLARSTDGGRTFANYAWAENSFESSPPAFLGDYTWLTAHNGKVYGAWTEALPIEAGTQAGRPLGPATVVRLGTADFGASP